MEHSKKPFKCNSDCKYYQLNGTTCNSQEKKEYCGFFRKSTIIIPIIFLIAIFGIGIINASPTMFNCTSESSIVACYHFNNDSSVGENYTSANSRIYDYSNNHLNNLTTFGNITYNKTGGFLKDGSFYLDGSNDYMNGSSNNLCGTQFSINFWLNPSNFTASRILSKHTGFGANQIYTIIFVSTLNNFSIDINFDDTNGRFNFGYFYPNEWTMLTLTYDNSTRIANIYKNGLLLVSKTFITTFTPSACTAPLKIGTDFDLGQHYNGTIDELVIFNSTLNSSYINSIYQSSGCEDPYSGMNISDGLVHTFCYGSYDINDNINISNNSKILMQNVILNFTDTAKGIYVLENSNISIINSTIQRLNFNEASARTFFFANNSYVFVNNSIFNGIGVQWDVFNANLGRDGFSIYNSSNSIISNSIFNNTHMALRVQSSTNVIIKNNSFSNINYESISFNGNNSLISYNNINSNCSDFIYNYTSTNPNAWELSYSNIIFSGRNNIISNNTLNGNFNCRTGIWALGTSIINYTLNNTIYGNKIYNFTDQGIYLSQYTLTSLIYNNTIINNGYCSICLDAIGDSRGGDMGILFETAHTEKTSSYVYGNYIENWQRAISMDSRSSYNYIYNNTCNNSHYGNIEVWRNSSFNNIYNNLLYNAQTGIQFVIQSSNNKIYNNYVYNSSGNTAFLYYLGDNTENIFYDNYFYDDIFLSYFYSYYYNGSVSFKNDGITINATFNSFNISAWNSTTINNIAMSSSNNASIEIYNLSSNTLVYISNSTGIINQTNINITLNSSNGKIGYIIQDFNCSESSQSSNNYPCGRLNSPINITSISTGNPVTYTIKSSLTNNISIPFIPSISCSNLVIFDYKPSSSPEVSLTDTAAADACNQMLTGSYPLVTSPGDNQLILYYTQSPGGSGGSSGSSSGSSSSSSSTSIQNNTYVNNSENKTPSDEVNSNKKVFTEKIGGVIKYVNKYKIVIAIITGSLIIFVMLVGFFFYKVGR